MTHGIFWFALVGWTAGWVTGRQIKYTGRGAWSDALIGLVGGLACGYPLRTLEHSSNWGLLVSVLCAAGGAAVLTWAVNRAGRRIHQAGH